jgi:transcriptional regulator with XRE-family HTH domain
MSHSVVAAAAKIPGTGRAFLTARLALGISRRQVAAHLKVAPDTLLRWEASSADVAPDRCAQWQEAIAACVEARVAVLAREGVDVRGPKAAISQLPVSRQLLTK